MHCCAAGRHRSETLAFPLDPQSGTSAAAAAETPNMEGVGARLGRSSSRYGPTPVFTGPVRKWKKKWVHVLPPANGTVNGNNESSQLLLYKWTAITPEQIKENDVNDDSGGNNDKADLMNSNEENGVAAVEPPKRRFKYLPIVALEEQRNDSEEQMEDDSKTVETLDINSKNGGGFEDQTHTNDVLMDDKQATLYNRAQRQDLNESTLDLSLGLKAHDAENSSDSR